MYRESCTFSLYLTILVVVLYKRLLKKLHGNSVVGVENIQQNVGPKKYI
jgi:hypothetical protein